jgi:hypothetical protein
MSQEPDEDPQLHTLGLVEALRHDCFEHWEHASEYYFRVRRLLEQLANPNLHDISTSMPFRVELWDDEGIHIRWVLAACGNIMIYRGAFNVATQIYAHQYLTLRQGTHVIERHPPKPRDAR